MTKKPKEIQEKPPAWKMVLCWSSVLWLIFVIIKFDGKFPLNTNVAFRLFEELAALNFLKFLNVSLLYLKSLVLFAAIIVGSASLGVVFLPRQEEFSLTRIESFVLSLGLGHWILTLAIFLMGILGWYHVAAFYGLILLALGVGFGLRRNDLNSWGQGLREWKFSSIFSSPFSLLLTFLIGVVSMMCFVPEVFYDSLVYHLGLPQLFVNSGSIVNTPNVYFSRFPMHMHMLYVLGLGVDGASLAKLLNLSVLLAGLGGLYSLCRRLGYPKAGVIGALIIVSVPVVQYNNWSTAIDSAMGGYFVLAILAFTLWRQSGSTSHRWLLISGILAGCVFAIKYSGGVVMISFAALLLISSWKELGIKLLKRYVLFFGAVLVVMAPWFVRNIVWTGNPFYPILSSVFESRDMNAERIDREKGQVGGYKPKTLWDGLRLPWILTMKDIGSFNFIGPLILSIFPVLLLVPWSKNGDIIFYGMVFAVYFCFALFFTREIRYLLPGFFILCGALGIGLVQARISFPVGGSLLGVGLFFGVLYHGLWIFQYIQSSYQPAHVVTGVETRHSYQSRYHSGLNPWPAHSLAPDIEKLPPNSKIYVVGDEKVFGIPRPFHYSTVHDDTPLVIWANESQDVVGFMEKLREEGITHFLLNYPESLRLYPYKLYRWSEQGRRNFLRFWDDHLKLVAVKGVDQVPKALFLFEMVDKTESPAASVILRQLFWKTLYMEKDGKG